MVFFFLHTFITPVTSTRRMESVKEKDIFLFSPTEKTEHLLTQHVDTLTSKRTLENEALA